MVWCADKESKKVYIMMEARLEALFKSTEEYQVLERLEELMTILINMYEIQRFNR